MVQKVTFGIELEVPLRYDDHPGVCVWVTGQRIGCGAHVLDRSIWL